MTTKLEQRAIQLSIEFTDVDPVKVEKALAHVEAEAKRRDESNKRHLMVAEAKWRAYNTVGERIGILAEVIKLDAERLEPINRIALKLEADKLKAKMQRKVARMEAELELQKLREAESRMRKQRSFINGIWIPKPDEVAHLIQDPILNFR